MVERYRVTDDDAGYCFYKGDRYDLTLGHGDIVILATEYDALAAELRLAISARDYANDLLDRERERIATLESALANALNPHTIDCAGNKPWPRGIYPGCTCGLTSLETSVDAGTSDMTCEVTYRRNPDGTLEVLHENHYEPKTGG